ncbi:ArsR family transcriptional regulator [Actinoplanes sp. SE50]|uniref:ArsR/SmtB family transcription factor n=1 Tax=unclassified Actinoplanes TaxID=2626549 RepID=UPI00023ECABC|nr:MULTISPECIES: helix-turn-helix domain-containing protein [unclassified Actinoplanes]AEV82632.1 ArsR family transcriptional regulator [Actinoplanes sp. SE50/110]ATO81028.1 ArsR family transcriptional regulator [Actinoplanes sp. SE50]SLL98435.1 transcriptional regulator [Actinoplanes sp. SE50/110]
MGWWQIDADTLAGSRFVLSPLAETTAGLMRLRWDSAEHPADRPWLRAHRPAYRARLAADPITARLVDAALRPHWIADFMAPPPEIAERSFAAEVAVIRATVPAAARQHIAEGLAGGLPVGLGREDPGVRASAGLDREDSGTRSLAGLPAELDRDDLGERMAGLLTWLWQTAIAPDWPRRRRILEADVLARTRQLTQGGWQAALNGMRDGMRWLGGGRLQINAYDYPPRDISGAQLLFVPTTLGRGWAAWENPDPTRYALIYRASGVLAEPGRAAPGALERLLGAGRAGVLVALAQPKSTSQLVAITGLGLGSVGRHLRVLLEAGLVMRRRAGRSVLYTRTPAGESVVRAASV